MLLKHIKSQIRAVSGAPGPGKATRIAKFDVKAICFDVGVSRGEAVEVLGCLILVLPGPAAINYKSFLKALDSWGLNSFLPTAGVQLVRSSF